MQSDKYLARRMQRGEGAHTFWTSGSILTFGSIVEMRSGPVPTAASEDKYTMSANRCYNWTLPIHTSPISFTLPPHRLSRAVAACSSVTNAKPTTCPSWITNSTRPTDSCES